MNEEFSVNSNQIVTPISESVRIQYVQIRVYRTRQTYQMERYRPISMVDTTLQAAAVLKHAASTCLYRSNINSIQALSSAQY